MSQENVELARRLFPGPVDCVTMLSTPEGLEALQAATEAVMHPDWETVTVPGQVPLTGADAPDPARPIVRGLDGFVSAFGDWVSAWASWVVTATDFIDVDGDRVLVLLNIQARSHTHGVEMPVDGASLLKVRDGRVSRMELFFDRAEALEAAGLREQTMPQETRPQGRELLEATLEAVNARDFEALGALLGPEMEFRSVLGATEGEVYTGVEGMRKWAAEVDAVWEDWHQEVVDYRELGEDHAVAVIRATGRARASGVPLDTRTGNVFTRQHGKWRTEVYANPREALEAVGLRE